MSFRIATLIAVSVITVTTAGAAVGAGGQAATATLTHRDFHGTVAWAHRGTHTFALRTRSSGTIRLVTTARTRYDHRAGFAGCRAGRELTVHARRSGTRWTAIEVRRGTSHHGSWHDGHDDDWDRPH